MTVRQKTKIHVSIFLFTLYEKIQKVLILLYDSITACGTRSNLFPKYSVMYRRYMYLVKSCLNDKLLPCAFKKFFYEIPHIHIELINNRFREI